MRINSITTRTIVSKSYFTRFVEGRVCYTCGKEIRVGDEIISKRRARHRCQLRHLACAELVHVI